MVSVMTDESMSRDDAVGRRCTTLLSLIVAFSSLSFDRDASGCAAVDRLRLDAVHALQRDSAQTAIQYFQCRLGVGEDVHPGRHGVHPVL
jgi:hypothetical protein